MECVHDRKKVYRCKSCKWCGNPSSEDSPSLRNWCSFECRQKHNDFGVIERHMRRMTLTRLNKIKQCPNCRLAFVKKQKTQTYCCHECTVEDKRASKTCILCGKRFDVWKHKAGERKYCSLGCANAHKKQLYVSPESLMQVEKKQRRARLDKARQHREQFEREIHKGWGCCIFCGKASRKISKHCNSKQCRATQRMLKKGAEVKRFKCISCEATFEKLTTFSSILYCSKKCTARENKASRRVRIKSNGSYEHGVTWLFVAKKFEWVCQRCGCTCIRPTGSSLGHEATLDHVIPIAKGGEHTKRNADLLCRRCNTRKGDRA